jgi:hypothetical protein
MATTRQECSQGSLPGYWEALSHFHPASPFKIIRTRPGGEQTHTGQKNQGGIENLLSERVCGRCLVRSTPDPCPTRHKTQLLALDEHRIRRLGWIIHQSLFAIRRAAISLIRSPKATQKQKLEEHARHRDMIHDRLRYIDRANLVSRKSSFQSGTLSSWCLTYIADFALD